MEENPQEELKNWLLQADKLMSELQREVALVLLPSRRTALQHRISALKEDIAHFEERWIKVQETERRVDQLYMELAESHFDARNYDLALKSYNQAVDRARDKRVLEMALLERAETFGQLGRWEEALTNYDELDNVDHRPWETRRLLGRGTANYFLNDLNRARMYFKDASITAHKTDNVNDELIALSYLGAIATLFQNHEEALDYYQRAINLGVEHLDSENLAHLYVNQGKLFRQAGNNEAAKESYKRATELDTKNAETYEGLGLFYQSLKRWDEAETYLQKALELNPDHGSYLVNMGTLQVRRRDFEKAQKFYSRAIEMGWDGSQIYDGLGTCELALGRWDAAEKAFRKALDLSPDSASSWGNLGVTLFREGLIEAARKACAQSVQTGKAGPVEEGWFVALSKVQGIELAEEDIRAPLVGFLAGKKEAQYEPAEYEGARLVSLAAVARGEFYSGSGLVSSEVVTFSGGENPKNFEEMRLSLTRKVDEDKDELARFYWENARRMLELLKDARTQKDTDHE